MSEATITRLLGLQVSSPSTDKDVAVKMKRERACETVARSLREFGYRDVTAATVGEILVAWLEGKRDAALPHGIVGMMAGRQFDEIERDHPGILAALKSNGDA